MVENFNYINADFPANSFRIPGNRKVKEGEKKL